MCPLHQHNRYIVFGKQSMRQVMSYCCVTNLTQGVLQPCIVLYITNHCDAFFSYLSACRGQVIRVNAPWVKHFYFTGLNSYILPNVDTVVLGGTTQKNSWDTTVSQEVRLLLMGC